MNTGYKPDADLVLWSAEEQANPKNSWSRIRAAIKSYDGKHPMIALERPESNFYKLGRLTRREAVIVRDLLERAIQEYDGLYDFKRKKSPHPRTTARSEARKKAMGGDHGK